MSISNFFGGGFFGGGFFGPGTGNVGSGRSSTAQKAKRREPPTLIRFVVELGDDKHYFRTESEARSFMEKRARVVYKRAKAVARKTQRIELPAKAQRIPIDAPSPIPRFVASGSASVELLTSRINAKIDAILANPEREADEDDSDLERILLQ